MTTQRPSNRVATCARNAQRAPSARAFPPGLITFLANLAALEPDAFDSLEEFRFEPLGLGRQHRGDDNPANDNGQPAPPPNRCRVRTAGLADCGRSGMPDRISLRRAS